MWKVAKLSPGQLLDVRPEDVMADGWFRICHTYRGGGGYDQFPNISQQRLGFKHDTQFIVQLYGCNLDCPYCYVTREGVWGQWREFSTERLTQEFAQAFSTHGATVFHLMGGAPALQIKQWPALLTELDKLPTKWAFHSDMMLTERPYDPQVLSAIKHPKALYAVNVKGLTEAEHQRNTRKPWNPELFWTNLTRLEQADIAYYLTFTAIADDALFWDEYFRRWPQKTDSKRAESFAIDLISYEAIPHVDSRPWGARHY